MPKKVHGRPSAKARQRTRRPVGPSVIDSPNGQVSENGIVVESRPARPSTSPSTTSGARPAARPDASEATKRTPSTVRKAPGLVINYQYLRRDIRTLGVLAPSMVVLLVIAFFVFR